MVVHAFNPPSWKVPKGHQKVKAGLNYRMKFRLNSYVAGCVKKKKKKKRILSLHSTLVFPLDNNSARTLTTVMECTQWHTGDWGHWEWKLCSQSQCLNWPQKFRTRDFWLIFSSQCACCQVFLWGKRGKLPTFVTKKIKRLFMCPWSGFKLRGNSILYRKAGWNVLLEMGEGFVKFFQIGTALSTSCLYQLNGSSETFEDLALPCPPLRELKHVRQVSTQPDSRYLEWSVYKSRCQILQFS